jgi:hypothetical protein
MYLQAPWFRGKEDNLLRNILLTRHQLLKLLLPIRTVNSFNPRRVRFSSFLL